MQERLMIWTRNSPKLRRITIGEAELPGSLVPLDGGAILARLRTLLWYLEDEPFPAIEAGRLARSDGGSCGGCTGLGASGISFRTQSDLMKAGAPTG